MTSAGLLAVPDGQSRLPALRSRDLSGIRSRATSPVSYTKHVVALREHVHDIGGEVWVARPSAGALLGFDDCPLTTPYHLVVPRGRNITRIGLVVHTARSMDGRDVTTVDGLPVTSGTRTLIDLAAGTDRGTLTTYLDSALRDRTTTEDFLHRRLVELRTHGRAGLAKLLDVIAGAEATRGGHSWLERRFLELLVAAGLPRPDTQDVVTRRTSRLIRVDCRFPGTPVVVELLGYGFHRTRLQLDVDSARLNQLVLDGFVPLQFTYTMVVSEPATCVAAVRTALDPVTAGRRLTGSGGDQNLGRGRSAGDVVTAGR